MVIQSGASEIRLRKEKMQHASSAFTMRGFPPIQQWGNIHTPNSKCNPHISLRQVVGRKCIIITISRKFESAFF
jgi:hypothetical protein